MKTKSELLEKLNKIEIKINNNEKLKEKKKNITFLKDIVLVNHVNVTFRRLSEIASEIGADDLLIHFVDYKTLENVVKNVLETNGMSDAHNLLKRIDSLTYSVCWLDGYMIPLRGISGYARNVNIADLERLKEKLRHQIENQYKENENK